MLELWMVFLGVTGLITIMGRKLKILPIICQLSFIMLMMPLVHHYVLPEWHVTTTQMIISPWIKLFYSINFTLLFAYILSDMIDLKYDIRAIKIALPSFFIPFIIGLITAIYFIHEHNWITITSLGLVFSITAIPVLYLYLKAINYSEEGTKKLVQAAIWMDIFCWSIFALVKDSTNIQALFVVLSLGLIPLIGNFVFKIKQPKLYSVLFFVVMLVLDHYKYNILLFGISYMSMLGLCKIKFILPISEKTFHHYQTYIAVPFIIMFGVIQINYQSLNDYSISWITTLILIPIISKTIGNYIGLKWSQTNMPNNIFWLECTMLNTRGLTEIVFLNMLFQQHIISQEIYFAMMLMGLISTLCSGIYGNYVSSKKINYENVLASSKQAS